MKVQGSNGESYTVPKGMEEDAYKAQAEGKLHEFVESLRAPAKKGGMIKRKDGSYSRRGLWDNIRANRGSGRKPTKEMLRQEAKIRAKAGDGLKVGYTSPKSMAEAESMIADKRLKVSAPNNDGAKALKYGVDVASMFFYPASLVGAGWDLYNGDINGAVAGVIPFGSGLKVMNDARKVAKAAGLSSKLASKANRGFNALMAGHVGSQIYDTYNDLFPSKPTPEKKANGGAVTTWSPGEAVPFHESTIMGKGGYTVKRSSARKGKTHVVIGPDGTKKYFGDSKLGQHPNDPARKKAFYARHAKNLKGNPYFRAFARATWADGGKTGLGIYNMGLVPYGYGGVVNPDGTIRSPYNTPAYNDRGRFDVGGFVNPYTSGQMMDPGYAGDPEMMGNAPMNATRYLRPDSYIPSYVDPQHNMLWRDIGEAGYGLLEGTLDTVTGGLTDPLTDLGHNALQKAGGYDKLSRKEQKQLGIYHGAGTTGGAALGTYVTAGTQAQAGIGQAGKGVGEIVRSASSDDNKTAQAVGTYLPLAASIGANFYNPSSSINAGASAGKQVTGLKSATGSIDPYSANPFGGGSQFDVSSSVPTYTMSAPSAPVSTTGFSPYMSTSISTPTATRTPSKQTQNTINTINKYAQYAPLVAGAVPLAQDVNNNGVNANTIAQAAMLGMNAYTGLHGRGANTVNTFKNRPSSAPTAQSYKQYGNMAMSGESMPSVTPTANPGSGLEVQLKRKHGGYTMADGGETGMVPINVEGANFSSGSGPNAKKGELLVNNGRIVKNYVGRPPHPAEGQNPMGDDDAPEGLIVIPKARTKEYLEASLEKRKQIERSLVSQQQDREMKKSRKMGDGGYYSFGMGDMGMGYGGMTGNQVGGMYEAGGVPMGNQDRIDPESLDAMMTYEYGGSIPKMRPGGYYGRPRPQDLIGARLSLMKTGSNLNPYGTSQQAMYVHDFDSRINKINPFVGTQFRANQYHNDPRENTLDITAGGGFSGKFGENGVYVRPSVIGGANYSTDKGMQPFYGLGVSGMLEDESGLSFEPWGKYDSNKGFNWGANVNLPISPNATGFLGYDHNDKGIKGGVDIRLGHKKGGWIQKATASIKRRGTEGVCTGSKFGSSSCPPGSRRYNLAKTFKKMARSRHEFGGPVTHDFPIRGLKYAGGGAAFTPYDDESTSMGTGTYTSFPVGGNASNANLTHVPYDYSFNNSDERMVVNPRVVNPRMAQPSTNINPVPYDYGQSDYVGVGPRRMAEPGQFRSDRNLYDYDTQGPGSTNTVTPPPVTPPPGTDFYGGSGSMSDINRYILNQANRLYNSYDRTQIRPGIQRKYADITQLQIPVNNQQPALQTKMQSPYIPKTAEETQWDCSSGMCRPILVNRNLQMGLGAGKAILSGVLPVSGLEYTPMTVNRPTPISYDEAIRAAKQAEYRDVNAAREAGSSNMKRFLAARAVPRDTTVSTIIENARNAKAQQDYQFEADKRAATQYNNQMAVGSKQYKDQGKAAQLYGIMSGINDIVGGYNTYVNNLAMKRYLDSDRYTGKSSLN